MRNKKIDYIKGITIILMLLGHCIQFGSGLAYEEAGSFFSNKIFQLIYSFHMPLFMLLSGYFFASSMNKHTKVSIAFRKCYQLLLPVFAWSSLRIILIAIKHKSEFSVSEYIFWWVSDSCHNFWFIWVTFALCITVLLVNVLFKDSVPIYFILFILLFIIPDGEIGSYKFMYPYFIFGYLIGKKNVPLDEINWINSKQYAIAYSCIFVIGFLFFKTEILTNMNYCLLSSQSIKIDLFQIVYKYTLGAIGSLAIVSLIYILYKEHRINSIICTLGQETLGIYIIQVLLNHIVLRTVTQNFSHNIFINFFEMIVELLVCHFMIQLINKTKWTRFLFLGHK